MNRITATTKHLGKVTVKVGDRVRFLRPDGVICEDVVRDCFMQTTLLQPYAENLTFPAVVLTEHSWIALSSIVAKVPESNAIQMHRSHKIDGVMVSFRRSIVGWVACFGGSDRCIHFKQPIKNGVWVARRPMALEPLATAATLSALVMIVTRCYKAEDRRIEAKIAARLNGAA